MTRRREPHSASRQSAVIIAAVAVATSLFGSGAEAQARELHQTGTPAELEHAFWACDYAVTTGRVDTGTAIACVTITDQLKATKFAGDFDAMVAWWRQNKAAEHRTLAAGKLARSMGAVKPSDPPRP